MVSRPNPPPSYGTVTERVGPDKAQNEKLISKLRDMVDAAKALEGLSLEEVIVRGPSDVFGASVSPAGDFDFDDGYCYLGLFADEHHEDASNELKFEPSVAAINRFANSRASPWAAHGVSAVAVERASGFVWHLRRGKVTPVALLRLMDKTARVGASEVTEVRRDLSSDVGERPSASAGLLRSGGGRTVYYPFCCNLPAGHTLRFNPATSTGLSSAFGFFESVELVSATFTAHVVGDSSTVFYGTVAKNGHTSSVNIDTALASQHCVMTSGSNDSSVQAVLRLPANHRYGREVKGTAVGNPTPVFCFGLKADGGADARISGTIEFYASGEGIPDAIILRGTAAAGGV